MAGGLRRVPSGDGDGIINSCTRHIKKKWLSCLGKGLFLDVDGTSKQVQRRDLMKFVSSLSFKMQSCRMQSE